MTNFVAANQAVDLTTWAFTPGWRGTTHSATQFVIVQDSTNKSDTFTGTGFGNYDIHNFPTVGTITGIQFAQNGVNFATITNFSMSVADESNFASHQNMPGFLALLLGGDDTFSDSTQGDHFFGLNGNDTFHMTHGGADFAEGNDGTDLFDYGAQFGATDRVDGGSGIDTLFLNGDYSGGVTFGATTMTGVENLNVAAGHDYSLTLNDANVGAGQTLFVHGNALGVGNSLTLNGSAETDGSLNMTGGHGADNLTGGAANDILDGGEGSDHLTGGDGTDTVSYANAADGMNVNLQTNTATGIDGTDTLASIENAVGSAFADTITGSSTNNFVQGGGGNDNIFGGSGGGGGEGEGGEEVLRLLADPPVNHDLIDGLGGAHGFGENFLAPNDDGSTGAIDITSVFGAAGLNFFGHDYAQLFVNNNGNITFAVPTGQFTPSVIDAGANNPIIAAFWADVDTRGPIGNTSEGGNSDGSDLVWYDLDAVNHVFTVTWDDVGYYSGHDNLVNAFQIQLIDQGDGDFDIVFRYEEIQWTTGDASGGSGGHGGTPARAGYSAGNGSDYFEFPQSGNEAAMLGLEDAPGNGGIEGVFTFQVRGGDVVGGGHDDDVLDGNDGADNIYGGSGDDVMHGGGQLDHLFGGAGNDRLAGGGAGDILDGGAGVDAFHFDVDPGLARQTDTIVGFNAAEDKIDIAMHIDGLDPAVTGQGTLGNLLSELGHHHAQLVTRTDGQGHVTNILIAIDTNGVTGWQRGADMLIDLDNPTNLNSLSLGTFI